MKHLLLSSILMLGNASALAESLLITDARLMEQGLPTDVNYDILVSDGVINRIGENLSEVAADAVIDAASRPVTGAFFAGITALASMKLGWCPILSILDLPTYTPV